MTRLIKSFGFAINGFKTVLKEEKNFQIEIFFSLIVLFLSFYFEFSLLEFSMSVLSVGFLLCAEMVNTAVEDLCNKIEPNTDSTVGKIKDIMAGFVLLAGVISFLVIAITFYSHFR